MPRASKELSREPRGRFSQTYAFLYPAIARPLERLSVGGEFGVRWHGAPDLVEGVERLVLFEKRGDPIQEILQ